MTIIKNTYLPTHQDYIDPSIDQKSKPEHERDIRFIGIYGEVTVKYVPSVTSWLDNNYYPAKYIATVRQSQIDNDCSNTGVFMGDHGSRHTAVENLYAEIGKYLARKDAKKVGIGCAGMLD